MSTAKHLRGPYAYTCHVCKVEFFDGRTRRQDTCRAEFCRSERHRLYQLAKSRAQGRPKKADPNVHCATDDRAIEVWNRERPGGSFAEQMKNYYAAKASPLERRGSCWA
jgi:hypothetical protein